MRKNVYIVVANAQKNVQFDWNSLRIEDTEITGSSENWKFIVFYISSSN